MKKITITNPVIEDVDIMYQWGRDNWELWGDKETKWYTRKSLEQWVMNPRDDVLLVARVDGVLAGMCVSSNLRSWAYCAGLFVDKPYRKKGIGRMLVEEAIGRFQTAGVDDLVFLVDQKNTEGYKFYQKIQCKEGEKFIWMYKVIQKGETDDKT